MIINILSLMQSIFSSTSTIFIFIWFLSKKEDYLKKKILQVCLSLLAVLSFHSLTPLQTQKSGSTELRCNRVASMIYLSNVQKKFSSLMLFDHTVSQLILVPSLGYIKSFSECNGISGQVYF